MFGTCVRSVGFMIVAVSVVSCTVANAKKSDQSQVEKPQVFVDTLSAKKLVDEIIYPAKVLGDREIDVVAEVGGIVHQLPHKFGDSVNRGQLIMSLKNPDPLLGYKSYAVTADFAGNIGEIFVQEGDRVQVGQKLFRLIDGRNMRFQVRVNPQDLKHLSNKMPAKWVAFDGGQTLDLKVWAVSRNLDPKNGTGLCELRLADARQSQVLASGMVGRIRFELNERMVVTVPEKALFYKNRKPHLIIVGPGDSAQYSPIELIRSHDDLVEIKGELTMGTRYVTQSSSYIAEGEALAIDGGVKN